VTLGLTAAGHHDDAGGLMSISRLMSEQVSRAAAMEGGQKLEGEGPRAPNAEPRASDDALTSLTKYIPTEVLTLYLPAVAIVSALDEPLVMIGKRATYWAFAAALTPLISLLVYLRRRAIANLSIWPPWSQFPLWNLIAASVAFLAWALALPGNPYVDKPAMHVASGFAALLASTILSLLEPLFVRRAG
jgi:hypothetical protein